MVPSISDTGISATRQALNRNRFIAPSDATTHPANIAGSIIVRANATVLNQTAGVTFTNTMTPITNINSISKPRQANAIMPISRLDRALRSFRFSFELVFVVVPSHQVFALISQLFHFCSVFGAEFL